MEHYAMKYEYLIRKAFNCSRFGVSGANADIYRGYEVTQTQYEKGLEKHNNYEAGRKAGRVSTHIQNAVAYVKKKYEDNISSEQYEKFDDYTSLLYEPSFQNVEKAIDGIHELFSELGLSIG